MSAFRDAVDPIDYLAGTWSLRRELLDERTEARGYFAGSATFERETAPRREAAEAGDADGVGERLVYVERGELDWPTYRGPASRSLGYRRTAPGSASVHFADGRDFHLLELRASGYDAVHHCGEDLYRGRFALVSPVAWSVIWTVRGPTKSLRLSSTYSRPLRTPRLR